jgi:ABC-type sugar transport system substrate-binding protein
MKKNEDKKKKDSAEVYSKPDRRSFLKGSAAVAAGVAGASLVTSQVAQAATEGTLGPARHLIQVIHEIGPWHLGMDTACKDFCDMAGWTYQQVATQSSYNAAGMTKDISDSMAAKPDVLVTTMPGDGIIDILKEAFNSVPYLAINHAFNDKLVLKEIPGYFAGFTGEIPEISGATVADGVARELIKQGRKTGVIACGNPVPGHEFVGRRVTGMKEAVTKVNAEAGTEFTFEEFDDKSIDLAAAVPIYKTYFRRHGDNLGGFSGLGNYPTTAILQAMEELDISANKFPIATIDTAPASNQAVLDGYVLFIYDNQYYAQAAIPVAQAWHYLERSMYALTRYPTGSVLTKDTIGGVIARDEKLYQRAKEAGLVH